jgi:hypothetical protein
MTINFLSIRKFSTIRSNPLPFYNLTFLYYLLSHCLTPHLLRLLSKVPIVQSLHYVKCRPLLLIVDLQHPVIVSELLHLKPEVTIRLLHFSQLQPALLNRHLAVLLLLARLLDNSLQLSYLLF